MTETAPTTVMTTTVACDGDQETGGHPRVYVKLDADTHKAVCPYCSKTFVLDANAKSEAH
ncbi:MAG: zinc-finger domain-containing protein [Magnetovibrio sp.]|nr:zinc-finger domain-containing protein [Magnetovibrio sp.]